MRVVHLTTVHRRYDTRIFLKQCRSLAAAGHDVSLLVADGLDDEKRDGVRIIDTGGCRGRISRILGATRRILARARALEADVYHLHDPELLPVGLVLKRRANCVVADAHEDLRGLLLSKPYLHAAVRGPVALAAAALERCASRQFDAVVAATPSIAERFLQRGVPAIVIHNFPMAAEFQESVGPQEKANEICYVGDLTAIRGIRELVMAMSRVGSDVRLNLGGSFSDAGLRDQATALAGWDRVNEMGFLPRDAVGRVLGRSVAGVVTFLPDRNHINALPNKMFEYMSAGLPVIASNFPLWREVIEGNGCGICVDPCEPAAIAEAIDRLAADASLARRMGENGRMAVLRRYNWATEERKLIDLYERLCARLTRNET